MIVLLHGIIIIIITEITYVKCPVECLACGQCSGIDNSFILVKQLKCARCQENDGKYNAFDQETQWKAAKPLFAPWKILRILFKLTDILPLRASSLPSINLYRSF